MVKYPLDNYREAKIVEYKFVKVSELIQLCSIPGISGREELVRGRIASMIPGICKIDSIGNLIYEEGGSKDVTSVEKDNSVLLMAHMDEIGFYITDVREDGKLTIRNVGGIIEETLPGTFVEVVSQNGIMDGVIGAVPPHLKGDGEVFDKCVDVGAKSRNDVYNMGISELDYVVFKKTGVILNNDNLAMRSLDDRFGCYTLSQVVNNVRNTSNYISAWTVQEEVGLRGAKALTQLYKPRLAIAIDSFACCSKQNKHIELGKGPVIRALDNSSISDMPTVRSLIDLAHRSNIPVQIGATGGGNDASVFLEMGVPMIAISVPVRYLHSQVEMINLLDLDNLIKLLIVFLEVF